MALTPAQRSRKRLQFGMYAAMVLAAGSASRRSPSSLLSSEANGLLFSSTDTAVSPFGSLEIKDAATSDAYYGAPFTFAGGKLTHARNFLANQLSASGLWESVAVDRPKLYRTISAFTNYGYWPESSRTNLSWRSTGFDNAYWNESGIDVIPAANQTGPDGTTSAHTLTATAGAALHLVFSSSITTTSGTAYAMSVFVKKGTHRYICFNAQGSANNYASAVFDLDGGGSSATQTSVGATSGTIVSTNQEAYPSGWYRLTVVSSNTGAATNVVIGFAQAATGNTFSTTGNISWTAAGTETFYVWQAQFEAGAFASSPIITAGATANRVADTATIATTLFNHSETAGTLYVQGYAAPGTGANQTYVSFDDGTASEQIRIVRDSSGDMRFIVTDDGVDQANINLGAVANGAAFKVAASWENNDFAASLNGGAVGTDTGGTLPTMTTLRIGTDITTSQADGPIVTAMHLPRAMSDAELIARTA